MNRQKKLYRSRTDKMFTGVAGGLGRYLEIDTTIVRIVFVLLFFASGGIALILYIVLAVIVPEEPVLEGNVAGGSQRLKKEDGVIDHQESSDAEKTSSVSTVRWIIATIVILIGLDALSDQFFPLFNFDWSVVWAALLIVAGLYLIVKPPNSRIKNNINSINGEDDDRVTEGAKDNNNIRLVTGVVLVVLGMLLLAQLLGWLTVSFGAIWSLWPLILIFFGLSLISPWRFLTWLVGILAVVLVIWAAITGFFIQDEPTTVQPIQIIQAANIRSAMIDIQMGAGKLFVSGDSEDLVSGSLESSFLKLQADSNILENKQMVTIYGSGSWKWTAFNRGVNNMNVRLSPDIPIDLKISTGAIDMEIDLREVITESVDVNTGASSLVMQLGDKANMNVVKIDAGASSIRLSLPREVGVQIDVDSGLSSANLPDFNKLSSTLYQSDNYDKTEKKINIDIDMGVSSLDIVWR